MAEQRSDNMTAEMEEEGLTILQKIEDMEIYALPLIERWSIAHQKLLGDDIAHCMNRMSQLASALTVAYYKKTSISELDETNKALQSHIRVAYRLGYLKGKSALMIFDRHANLKYKYGNRKFWCRGFYVDTVGRNQKRIEEYIRNQLQEDVIADQLSLFEEYDPFTGEKNKRK